MREIVPENAADYLRDTGLVPGPSTPNIRALGWGVSNIVLRVEVQGQAPFVLKQSREQLRTRAHWVSRLDRIWTEKAALEHLATVLPPGRVPKVLFEDRENYLFAMSCAPDDATVWKERLLAGEADPAVALEAGAILAAMHQPVSNAALEPFADLTVFDQLRLDPFYRTVALNHPSLANRLHALIDETIDASERTFVHADFSPKNILVHPQGLTLVDFETAHAGDPAFDLGFFLSHLLLKAVRACPEPVPYLELIRAFWTSYHQHAGLSPDSDRVRRSVSHTAACALARVDGKSPVDYLDEPSQTAVRRFARNVLMSELPNWNDLMRIAAREMLDISRIPGTSA